MAIRTKLFDGIGMIAQLPEVKLTGDGRLTPLAAQMLLNGVRNCINAINGKITFGSGLNAAQAGNIDGQTVEHLFSLANTEEEIPHDLGRKAIGYIVLAKDRACDIYESNRGSWDENTVRLKSSVASATVLILLI